MYAYCLFCETARCAEVAEQIRRRRGWLAIDPRIVQRKWVRGAAQEALKPLLPGYVFVYTADRLEAPRADFRLDGVLRLLGDDREGCALMGDDYRFAMLLRDCGGTIGILKAYREGDRVRLAEGALGGVEGEIIRLDRQKGRAQIQFPFAGAVCKTWVGYDLLN